MTERGEMLKEVSKTGSEESKAKVAALTKQQSELNEKLRNLFN